MKSNWVYYLLILLIIEKIIQHIAVTLALYFNWMNITSTVAVSPVLLMVAGAITAILFCFSLWGSIKKQRWAINLVIALALFDLAGEFVAQGRIDIAIPVSFIAAVLLLVLALIFRRQTSRV